MRRRFPHLFVLLAPYLLYGFGVFLNVLVITANGGYMPVHDSPIVKTHLDDPIAPGEIIDEVHRVMQHSDHLKFLADWIQIPRESVMSPGDMFLLLGDQLQFPLFVVWLVLLYKDHNSNQENHGRYTF